MDRDEVLLGRVIADLSQGHNLRQINGRLHAEACGSLPSMDTSFKAQRAISHEAIYTWSRHRPLLWGKPDSHAPIVQRSLATRRRHLTARTGSYPQATRVRPGTEDEPSWHG